MNRFVVFGTGKDYVSIVWDELKKEDDVTFFETPFLHKSKVIDFLCKAHSAFIINQFIQLPFRRIWKSMYPIESIKLNPDDKYYFYFYDNSICRYDPKYLHNYKVMNKNVYFIVNMGNAMYKRRSLLHPYINDIDVVYSSNEDDIVRYRFKKLCGYSNDYVSAEPKPFEKCEFDVCYIGKAYDRLDKIHNVYDRLKELGLKTDFHITGVNAGSQIKKDITYNKNMPYSDVVKRDCNSRSILEIVGDNPTMLTMRHREAIFMHRKLLTNNPYVLEASYYDPKYIKYFKDASEITEDFFSDKDPVDYNYSETLTARDMLDIAVKDIESGYRWRKRKKKR